MTKKIVIFIWEWNSEISFFQEFIKKYFSIKEESIKSWIIYQVKDHFIIFAHPIIWQEMHRWWDKTFSSPKTYIDINKKIFSSKYNFPNISDYEFIYLYLTDKDKVNSEKKLDWVDELIKKYCSWYIWKIEKIFAIQEIETWFLASLWEDFKENYPEINKIKLEEFYKNINIDSVPDTKELLKNIILKDTKIWTSQEYIWREFWKYMDIAQAKSKSNSFKVFIDKLDSLFD